MSATADSPSLQTVFDRLDAGREAATQRWSELLRIPGVSTDPAYADDVRRSAEWLVAELRELGFSADVRETEGHPVVIAHHPGPGEEAPHLLYYGHYDVQPADPVELWDTAPFEPTVVEGPHGPRMVARGAVDDKGQLRMWLEAFRAWQEVHGNLPARITVLLEGEEEIGSAHLKPVLERYRDELAADICIVSDTTMWDVDTPAITCSLRGLLYTELTCHGPSMDLHSGFYGGVAPNPLTALADVLAHLHDDDHRVTIPGFYDDVRELPAEQRAGWEALGFDERAFLSGIGVEGGSGEIGRSALERLWSRPACDVNGLYGGYTGEGAKTVIPAHGSAKVSFRLVPEQDPERIVEGFRAFLDSHTPPGCRIDLQVHSAAPGIRVPTDSVYLQAARGALEDVFGRPPVLMGCGGSIPVVAWVRDVLGIDTLLMGFGLDDDRMHSPNEKFEFVCFERGMKSHAAFLERIRQCAGSGS